MPPEETNALHLISDILDKLIDSQEENAKINAGVKGSIDETKEALERIETHFTDGFRSEIKNHVTEEMRILKKLQWETKDKTDKIADTLGKSSFWVRWVAAIIGGLAIVIIAIMELLKYIQGGG